MRPEFIIAAAAALDKLPAPMSPRGYSAGVGRVYLLTIVDSSRVDRVSDGVRSAIDEARGPGGHCIICNAANFEFETPQAFAVFYRARGYEPPMICGICGTCARRFDHAGLRRRASEALHRGPFASAKGDARGR